jgi:hypothetical protein
MVSLSPILKEEFDKQIEYWKPEAPPETTIYGDIGWAIIDNIDKFDDTTRVRIFEKMESGIEATNEPLGTVVATGMVEGIVNLILEDRKNFEKFLGYMGKKTREHAIAWADFDLGS